MKLLASATLRRSNLSHAERRPATTVIAAETVQKRRPTCRYVVVEDLDHLFRTGESRQILTLRWTR